MDNKAAKTFLFITLGVMAVITAAVPFFAGPLAGAWGESVNAYGFPLAAIFSIPALIALIAVSIVSPGHKKWLYKGDKMLILTNAAVMACVLILAGIRIFADFSFDMADTVRNLPQFILIVASAFLLGFSAGMFISGVQAIIKERKNTPPAERRPITYPQMFTLCWALFCTLFIGFGFIVINVGSDLDGTGFMKSLLYFGVFFLVLTAGISGLLCLIAQMWSRSKWISVLVALMTFVVALVLLITYIYLSHDNYNHYYLHDYESDYYDDYDYAETEPAEAYYYDDSWEQEYGSAGSIDELFGSDNTYYAVSDAIKYGVKHIDARHMADNPPLSFMPWTEGFEGGYWDDQRPGGAGSAQYWKLANFLFRRSCSTLLMDIFNEYKDLAIRLLPYEKYRDNGYERTVNLLIISYEDMNGDGSKFSKIYNVMSDNEMDYDDKKEVIMRYVSEIGREAYYYDYAEGRDLDDTLVMWGYSFWGRRYHECDGNPEDIYNVLIAVRDMYAGIDELVLREPDEIE